MKYGDSFYHIFTSGYNYTILSGENQVFWRSFSKCSQKRRHVERILMKMKTASTWSCKAGTLHRESRGREQLSEQFSGTYEVDQVYVCNPAAVLKQIIGSHDIFWIIIFDTFQ